MPLLPGSSAVTRRATSSLILAQQQMARHLEDYYDYPVDSPEKKQHKIMSGFLLVVLCTLVAASIAVYTVRCLRKNDAEWQERKRNQNGLSAKDFARCFELSGSSSRFDDAEAGLMEKQGTSTTPEAGSRGTPTQADEAYVSIT